MTKETKIGIFGFLICCLIGMGAFFFHAFPFRHSDSIEIHVFFAEASGIKAGNAVLYSGVSVGRITQISIVDGKADVTLALDKETAIPRNAQFTIDTKGLIGDSYIRVTGGTPAAGLLQDGMTLSEYQDDRMDKLMAKATHLMDSAEQLQQHVQQVVPAEKGTAATKGS